MSSSRRMLLLLVALLPIQLNKFFFTPSSLVLGIPIDYLAYSIYLSDIAIAIYIALFVFENSHNLKPLFLRRRNVIISLIILNSYLLTSALLVSKTPLLSAYFSLKVTEFCLLALFASIDFENIYVLSLAKRIATFSLFWQSLLAIFQFAAQKSLGLWFIGERAFDSSTPAIANANFFDNLLLRPYGSFPHPNVLGAFLVLYLIICSSDILAKSKNILKSKSHFFLKLTLALCVLAIILTSSKTALLILLLYFLLFAKNLKRIILTGFFLLLSSFLYVKFISFSHLTSIAERLVLFQAAYQIALASPLLGIGSTNFIAELAKLNLYSIAEVRLLQPVHNVFLLILSENGILGLLFFGFYLLQISKNAASLAKMVIFIALLAYLSIDHFLWSLHQGQFLFAITTAYILSSQTKVSSS